MSYFFGGGFLGDVWGSGEGIGWGHLRLISGAGLFFLARRMALVAAAVVVFDVVVVIVVMLLWRSFLNFGE